MNIAWLAKVFHMTPLIYNSVVTPESFTTDFQSLTDSITKYVLKSESVKTSAADFIAHVKKITTPPGKLDIMRTEEQECLRLAQPTSNAEQLLNFLDCPSKRQAPLRARIDELRLTIKHAEIKNEEARLLAGVIVECLYEELFTFNSGLQDALGLFHTVVALASKDPLMLGGKADWEATWLERGAKAFFALSGTPLDQPGERSEHLNSVLRLGQNILINSDPGAWHETSFRQLRDILAASGEIRSLNGAAIISRDGAISLSCNIDVEKLQQAARKVISPPPIERSDEDEPIGADERRTHTRAIMGSFIGLAEGAITQIENTNNEVRRCIMKALFPHTPGLKLLRELYPQDRAEELVREQKSRKR
jgi:hypothetical protein